MRRRDFLGVLPLAVALPRPALAQDPRIADFVQRQARALAAQPYKAPSKTLPPALATLDYDAYRDLRYRPDKALWRDLNLPFQLQMFHRAGQHADVVELFEVYGGVIRPIPYRADAFTAGPLASGALAPDLGFGGFRIHAQINEPGRFDEFAVFQGASYFRAIPRGGVYGLSARGIEIGSGEAGEEFPAFRSFFIERPAAGATSITVHALLDGPSLAGAYRFEITPGDPTAFAVTAVLYPRATLARVGIAPLTSMFLFGPEQPRRYDDFRPEVHDSDGLLAGPGAADRTWRPLANPARPEIIRGDEGPAAGFGLLQRARALEAYQDLEAHYHRRPGAWVAPASDWGAGRVQLVELHARDETEDNIVASWRPTSALEAGIEHRFAYDLIWSSSPQPPGPLAWASAWREGAGGAPGRRRYVVEFAGLDLRSLGEVSPEVTASAGAILHPTLQPNPTAGALRLSFEFDPGDALVSDLRARLAGAAAAPRSETWLRKWAADPAGAANPGARQAH